MKKFYLFVVTVVLFNVAFSAPVITASTNGYWNSASTWNLNRLPQVGDTIVIPGGKTVTIDDDQNFNGFVYLKIYGVLKFQNNNSTLSVDAPSVIMVFTAAQITGGGSPSQKIRYNNTTVFDGNDAAIIGPEMVTSGLNNFVPFVPSASSTLPVKFVGFTLTLKNSDVMIQWSTSEEINSNMYQVQKSVDGVNWNTIAYIAAIGNPSLNNYSFTDKNISAKLAYYRIKEVDINGKETMTVIRTIKRELSSSVTDIKIAGIQNKVLLQFTKEIKGNVIVRFISQNGQIIDQQSVNNPVGQVVLNSKVTGNYIISISNGQDINTSKQVIL